MAALTATYILPFIYAHAKVVPHICVLPKSPCNYIVSTWGPRGFLHLGPEFIIYSYMEQPEILNDKPLGMNLHGWPCSNFRGLWSGVLRVRGLGVWGLGFRCIAFRMLGGLNLGLGTQDLGLLRMIPSFIRIKPPWPIKSSLNPKILNSRCYTLNGKL